MRRILPVAALLLAATCVAVAATCVAVAAACAAEDAAPPVKAFSLKVVTRLEPAPDQSERKLVKVAGETDLPDQTIVQCHLHVTYGIVDGQERARFMDGVSAVVKDGRFEASLGPYVIQPSTFRIEAVVDKQRQYPSVQALIEPAPELRVASDFQFGTDEEVQQEREIGRPRALRSVESLLALTSELLERSMALKGPLERGEWEAAWLRKVRRLRDRLVPTPGRMIGRNEVSGPLIEGFDGSETLAYDGMRALLKAYHALAGVPEPAPAGPEGEGGPMPWAEEVTEASLRALSGRALDQVAIDYEQELGLRLEGMLRAARQLHEDETAPPKQGQPAPPREPVQDRISASLADCKALREELQLLTNPEAPGGFLKGMAERLLPVRDLVLALTQEVEAVVRGYGRAIAAHKPADEETAHATDRFYAGYAQFLMVHLASLKP